MLEWGNINRTGQLVWLGVKVGLRLNPHKVTWYELKDELNLELEEDINVISVFNIVTGIESTADVSKDS